MAILTPAPSRAQVHHSGGTIRIRIPPAPYFWVIVLLLSAWLAIWTTWGWKGIFQTGVQETLIGGIPATAVWSILWLYGLGAAAYHLFLVLGTETIEVSPSVVRYRRSLGGVGRWKEYALSDVCRLRTPEKGPVGTNSELGVMPRILFDYGAKTVKLGYGVDLAEAHQLVTEIGRLYPRLSQPSGKLQA